MSLPSPIPDDPRKWDGWKNYHSPNYYDRLCLTVDQNPSNELIEDHTRQLLVWWQKKLPLKNQPSNPLAQILWDGLDNAPRYLSEARLTLCNPETRKTHDVDVLHVARQKASEEFRRLFTFIAANGVLTDEGEASLVRFGAKNGLGLEDVMTLIERELADGKIERYHTPEVVAPAPVAASAATTAPSAPRAEGDPASEFKRVLKLSGLDSDSMTDDQRDALINMAENLGVDAGDAEDMVDDYLEEMDALPGGMAPKPAAPQNTIKKSPIPPPVAARPVLKKVDVPDISVAEERQRFPSFMNSLGSQMLLVPSGTFQMGSVDPLAAPNEGPCSKVKITRFYMSRHLVTTAAYEKFSAAHRSSRGVKADDRHPVIYVTSLDAIKFCQWLSIKEKRKYRLPTEAEWEYAARGTDERLYPWGNQTGLGNLANFADKNTNFNWSDLDIDDGFAETSPVGNYPRGASAFGIEDMAGNVWEWCSDFFEAYKGGDRVNPRGPQHGQKRIYRGGSWRSRFSSLRATTRNFNTPDYKSNDLGFRVVCDCE